jgi:hypothetical protein
VCFGDERLHGVGAKVVMELVHVHGLVWLPAVTGFSESSPAHLELKGGLRLPRWAMIDSTVNSCSLCWAIVNGEVYAGS